MVKVNGVVDLENHTVPRIPKNCEDFHPMLS